MEYQSLQDPTAQSTLEVLTTTKTSRPVNPRFYILVVVVGFLIATPSILLIAQKHKTSDPLSPLANVDKPKLVRQALQEEKQALAYYLAASQEYLNRARQLSQQKGNDQSMTDKKKIVDLLNESLKFANSAVTNYPSSPEGYRQRALLFQTISHLDPQASTKADRDLATATRLAGGSLTSPVPIKPEDLVNTSPLEEAALLNTVAIALPEGEKGESDTRLAETASAEEQVAVIPAGKTEIVVKAAELVNSTLVYFTPVCSTDDAILSLKTKDTTNKTFTLSLSKPLPHDLSVSWWLVNN